MTLYGYDAAYQPDLAAVKAAGGIAVNGYLTGNYATTTSSPAHALAAGLGWWATYEEGPSELVGATRATGQAVGRKILAAYTALRDDHGNPLPLDGSAAVYPSVDTSVAAADACDEAWRGLRDVLAGKLSIRYYGEGLVGDHLYQAGLIDGPFWLAAPSSWPGFDPADPRVCIVQEVGTNVPSTDRNHLITQPAALGAIWPAGSPYAGGTVSAQDVIDALKSAAGQAELKRAARDVLIGYLQVGPAGHQVTGTVDGIVRTELAHLSGPAQIAAAVVAALPKGNGAPLTEADVEHAVQAVLDGLTVTVGTAGNDTTKGAQ